MVISSSVLLVFAFGPFPPVLDRLAFGAAGSGFVGAGQGQPQARTGLR